jgi:hypothetical protein
MRTPDISAEMLVGAAGCASGSHTCRGTIPALTPKPRKKSANRPLRAGGSAAPPDRSVANERDPDIDASAMKPPMRHPVPTCDMTR